MKLVSLIVLFIMSTNHLIAQDSSDPSDANMPKFGLQADIFRNVRGVDTNYTANFSNIRDYQLTPGDRFRLTVTSGVNSDGSISNRQEYEIQLQNNYQLNLPFLGTINAKGYNLSELQQYVVEGIRNIIPAQYVNFVLVSPAQFNVFIYGGVVQPGLLTATPLMGVIETIALAGGFRPGGSYRNVTIEKQNGDTVNVDISRFYQEADLDANPTLEPGDKIYIPPASVVANISGNVIYAGYYELIPEENLADLIALAGGARPDTLTSKVEIIRIQEDGTQTLISLPLSKADQFQVKNGDQVVLHSTSEISDMITIEGAIIGNAAAKTGPIAISDEPLRVDLPFKPGITLLSVLDSVGGPSPLLSEEEQSVLKRKNSKGKTEIIEIDVKKLWETRDAQYNVDLKPGDLILIPMQTLKVFVTGYVNNPDAYDYMNGKTVFDYLLLAGGITENEGDPNGIFFVDEKGKKTKVKTTDSVSPGDNIFVAKKFLFKSDQFVSNLLITTGWITAIIAVVNTIWNFIDRVRGAL